MKRKTFVAVKFPESQFYMDREGFNDNAYLINDVNGIAAFGVNAYFIDSDWLDAQDQDMYKNASSRAKRYL